MLQNKSISISISNLRVLALIMIVSCHIMQAHNNKWAWVLNSGVQVFLFVSGYLFGHSNINSIKVWYYKRLKRIYIPLFIWCLVYVFLLFVVKDESVETKRVITTFLCLQQYFGGISGLEHLWFVTAILTCYLITPVFDKLKAHANIVFVFIIVLSYFELFVLEYYISLFFPIFVYSFAYFYVNIKRVLQVSSLFVLLTVSVFVIAMFNWDAYMATGSLLYNVSHVCWALTISLIVIELGVLLRVKKKPSIIGHIEKYSYDIYLVHHPLIIGPISILFFTTVMLFDIFIVLFATYVLSYALEVISTKVEKSISNKINI